MRRTGVMLLACALLSCDAAAQTQGLNAYFQSRQLRDDARAVAQAAPASREAGAIRNLLPHLRSGSFVEFVQARQSRSLLDAVDSLRLNKMIAGPPGTGGTSLVSRVAVPAILGAAIEYGSVMQRTTGTVTTLRANALGVGRMLFGGEQFPYCPEIDSGSCGAAARVLRPISAVVALEDARPPAVATPSQPPTVPTAAELLGDDFRVASWGLRLDLTPSNNLDDPKFVAAWSDAIGTLRRDPAAATLSGTIVSLFAAALDNEAYTNWMADTVSALTNAPTESDFYRTFEERLDLLASNLAESDPAFAANVIAVSRAYANYFDVRDALIREAQVHKLSLEFTNQRPQTTPHMSNLRLIYSHQPTLAPTLVTANASLTWYDSKGPNGERWRDLQLSGQIDRRLSRIPRFGHAVATFAVYYQWMKEDALIAFAPGTVIPGAGIELPGEVSTLLGTKGHIVVAQGQLAIPVGELLKIPFSVTFSNRSELIDERDVRGQFGLTLDIDSLFR